MNEFPTGSGLLEIWNQELGGGRRSKVEEQANRLSDSEKR